MTLKITAYVGPREIVPPTTGVGRHLLNVLRELREFDGVEIALFGSREIMDCNGHVRQDSPLHVFPGNSYPTSQRLMQNIWKWAPYPKYTAWCPESDWLYCPNENYVPSGRTRFACTVHDLYSVDPEMQGDQGPASLRGRRLLPRMLKAAHLVLCVSEFTRRRIMELYHVEATKLHVIGNGVDNSYLQFDRTGSSSPVDFPYLFSIGGFRRKKGADFMIRLAPALARRLPEHRWVIVGPVDPEYREAVDGLQNVQVVRRGLSDDEILRYSAFADASLMLSIYEGFGIPVLEAMALGVPVGISGAEALREVAADAAVVLDSELVEESAERVANLVESESQRSALIERGLARARQFSWRRCAERIHSALSGA